MRLIKIGVVIVCLLSLVNLGVFFLSPRHSKTSLVTIEQGMNSQEIAELLEQEGLISSKKYFLFLLRLRGVHRKIKAGIYEIDSKESTWRIISKLFLGESKKIRLTIPEGFTAREIAQLIKEKGLGEKDRFLQIVEERNLEGYLFPETYFVEYDVSLEEVIDMMTDQFNKVFTKEMEQRGKEFKLTKRDVVILASIIEKEAVKDEERPLISAVFHNRLKKRWYLESCATVQYALGEHKEKLTYKDVKVDSPYNTYIHFGLPPGPICNPGLAAIEAALYPAETDLMFFVTKGEGTHRFSTYYKKHLEVQKKKSKTN
ncbi:endolytic transglycosylase MltG [bacterium]|nr:endolytic transglycosylase MltG [bacterium]NIN92399.1 endolytic transglycosylase MltG [bacterium]NIO18513.1 endolytic transglycosylase MltG [bacterium]NIO73509.1 endolytic transglycosylase MltG [bacterium]